MGCRDWRRWSCLAILYIPLRSAAIYEWCRLAIVIAMTLGIGKLFTLTCCQLLALEPLESSHWSGGNRGIDPGSLGVLTP